MIKGPLLLVPEAAATTVSSLRHHLRRWHGVKTEKQATTTHVSEPAESEDDHETGNNIRSRDAFKSSIGKTGRHHHCHQWPKKTQRP